MNKIRILIFFIFLGIFAATFQIGSMSTVSEEDAAILIEELKKLILDIDGFDIFVHNTTLALPMFIPGFGIFWGLLSAWFTGFAVAAITTTTPELGDITPLFLFLSPFGIMELVAYSLGISRSFILIQAIAKKTNLRILLKPTIIEIGIAVGLLLAGGFIEFYMLDLVKNEGLDLPGF